MPARNPRKLTQEFDPAVPVFRSVREGHWPEAGPDLPARTSRSGAPALPGRTAPHSRLIFDTCTMFRPMSFAWYSALSARATSTFSCPMAVGVVCATPALIVT